MDERQVLKNLFEKRTPTTWYGTVVKRLSKQRYEVADETERIAYAECDPSDFYPVGAKVIIRDGQIIGSGELSGDHKIFEV